MDAFARAQAGDSEALSQLIRQHIPLVQALTRRFSPCEDAFQQGCMGLAYAIRHFDPGRGYQFSTYAVPVILGEMRKAFSKALGWRAKAALHKAECCRDKLRSQSGKEPSIQEIAKGSGIPAEEIALLMERSQPPVYDETGTLLSSLPDPKGEAWLLRLCIRDILFRLPAPDRWLLCQRFLLGSSQMELARRLHTTQSRISRREKKARLRFQAQWLEN